MFVSSNTSKYTVGKNICGGDAAAVLRRALVESVIGIITRGAYDIPYAITLYIIRKTGTHLARVCRVIVRVLCAGCFLVVLVAPGSVPMEKPQKKKGKPPRRE